MEDEVDDHNSFRLALPLAIAAIQSVGANHRIRSVADEKFDSWQGLPSSSLGCG